MGIKYAVQRTRPDQNNDSHHDNDRQDTGPDGFVQYSELRHDLVEHLMHLNDTLPAFVLQSNGTMKFGGGNSATGYVTEEAGGLLVFGKFINRQGSDITFDGLHDGNGNVFVADGPQGGQIGNPSYAAWNFNYGVAATGSHTLADFDIRMNVSMDGINFLELDYVKVAGVHTSGSDYVWALRSDHTQIVIGDDSVLSGNIKAPGALNKVGENSENIKFFLDAINATHRNEQPYHYESGHDFQVEIIGTAHGSSHVLVDHVMSMYV